MWTQWLQLASMLAQAYATSQGQDSRALGYLRIVTTQIFTPDSLAALKAEYQEKVAGNAPTTEAELTELDQRLADQSAGIQSA